MLVTANIFQPLISVFAAVIRFFHDSGGISWGWSIVLLTVCVRLVLVPLTIKQFSSMRKLQHLQPQMKAIQQKYKQDKKRQQEEMMKFYKDNEVNPLASCLPLVAQLPVFISLFYMLKKNLRTDICGTIQKNFQAKYAKTYMAHNHVTAKVAHAAAAGQTTACGPHAPGAGFLFIHDITNTASGLTLIVLLVLYVGTQLASTMLMSAPTMDASQRRLMMFMPLIFVVFIIRFPAGLIVYWVTTNTWTMAQQYTLKRLAGPPPAATVDITAGGPGSGGSSGNGGGSSGDGPAGGSSGGLGGLLRGLSSRASGNGESPARSGGAGRGNSNAARTPATPPRPPRKKKKRSGRRR
jgi:YidC/Oxa1 family membrane protein insertase